jgi:hypothetical protein
MEEMVLVSIVILVHHQSHEKSYKKETKLFS